MLRSSSQVQKDASEEDSSGSDAGLEPETDRFGFIVTDRSTAGSVGPSPELVRQREAKWINIMVQWDRILLKRTSKVKVQCQKGIPASLRAKCWPLLCGATARMKQNENIYQCLDSQSALQSWVDVINRDLDRQFPFHEMFLSKDGHGQRGLFRVLKAYTQYRPEEGYCQAQGPVTAVLLMNMPAEEAFWCLAQISEQYLPGYYSPLLEGVLFDAAILDWALKRMCPAVHKHLQRHGVEPLMFATDWLMCIFTRNLPFDALLRVWDLFFCHGARVLLQVAVVLVRRVLGRAEQRKKCDGQMETLEKLRGVREHVEEDADAFIAEVCAVPLSARDLEKQTEKELERWKKDRPSSTFDPRHRCTGYQMVWETARHRQQMREKMEREMGHLSVPITRSVSLLSLSPKRWRKGVKAHAGEREGGAQVVRNLSVGAKDRRWPAVNIKQPRRLQEDEDTDLQELTELSETEDPNLPNITAVHSEERFKDQTQEGEPRTGMDKSPIRETAENEEQTEEAKLIDPTGNDLQPTKQTELQSDSPSATLEQKNSKTDDQDGTENATTEPEIEGNVQRSQGDTVTSETAAEKGPPSDTVTEEAGNNSPRDAAKESAEPSAESSAQPGAEARGLGQTREKQGDNSRAQEDPEHSEHLHSKVEVREVLVSDDTGSEPSETLVSGLKAPDATQENEESALAVDTGGGIDETAAQSQNTERTSDFAASPRDTEDDLPDGKMSPVQTSPLVEPAPEQPQVLGSAGEDKNSEPSEENTVENCVFGSVKPTDSDNDLQGAEVRDSSPAQAPSRHSSRSSADFCIRKSSSSQGSRAGCRLSEDLFTVPQRPSPPQSAESNPGAERTEPPSNLGAVNSAQGRPDAFTAESSETNRTGQQQEAPDPPKGFGLFRKLRGQTSKNPKGAPKIQVPKILIQDFGDGPGTEKPTREYKEEKMNSRERRRRQREQERRTKEEEKLRKKREKEQGKATGREKRKAQTLGKDGAQCEKEKCDELHPAVYQSHSLKSSTSYAESYF